MKISQLLPFRRKKQAILSNDVYLQVDSIFMSMYLASILLLGELN